MAHITKAMLTNVAKNAVSGNLSLLFIPRTARFAKRFKEKIIIVTIM
jgi:hypothetical protein